VSATFSIQASNRNGILATPRGHSGAVCVCTLLWTS